LEGQEVTELRGVLRSAAIGTVHRLCRPVLAVPAGLPFFSTYYFESDAMPVYDYRCAACDTEFTLLMPMSRSADPAACPACAHSADRVIAAPRLNTMRADLRAAHQTNERSAHAPKMTSGHRCGAGCSHNHGKTEQPALKQSSSSKRPWMLGH